MFVDVLYFRGERARIPLSIHRAGIPTLLIATDGAYETIHNSESLYTYRFTNQINCVRARIQYLPTATLPLPDLAPESSPEYDLAFVGTVELLPQAKVVPVVRGEFNSKSAGVTPWVIDAGVRVSPLESIRVTFTGRAVQDQWWGFVSLNLVDVADNEGWRL